ncbi:OsmC family protein [Streptomyces sp. 4F14]|uniref:OsmC family protein n=1 Tax=Streptomyces sp. 4F14 TaxID=3394380 RepID=UPI003A8C565E
MPTGDQIDLKALQDTVDAVRANPELGRATFTVEGSWQGGFRAATHTGALTMGGERDESRVAKFQMSSDEPHAAMGTDTAPSPLEFVLHALAGCYTVTLAIHAALMGIELEGFRLELEGDIDMRGPFGIDPEVRPGIQQLRVRVHLDAPRADRKQLEELVSAVERYSAIRDTIANPVDVVTTLA